MSNELPKTRENLHVSTVEAQQIIWALAPRDWIGKRKAAIAKVSRDLGWKFSRAWNVAHGRARLIRAEEMDRLRLQLEQATKSADMRRGVANDISIGIATARADFAASQGGRDPHG